MKIDRDDSDPGGQFSVLQMPKIDKSLCGCCGLKDQEDLGIQAVYVDDNGSVPVQIIWIPIQHATLILLY